MYQPEPLQLLFTVSLFKGVVYILSLTLALLICAGCTVGSAGPVEGSGRWSGITRLPSD